MDPATTSQPFVLNRAAGKSIEFPILTPSDRVKYRNAFRLSRKLAKRENLLIAGIADSNKVKEELDAFDGRRLPERDVEEWVFDPEGQQAALLLHLQQTNPAATEADVDKLGLTSSEALDAAAGLLGIKLVYGNPDAEKKPDPTTGETEPSGAGSPTTSGATSDPAPTP